MAWVPVYTFATPASSSTGSGTSTPGPKGQDGAAWFSGAGVPSLTLGNNGDFWFQTDRGIIWRKVTAFFGAPPSWTPITDITLVKAGPAGSEGKQGIPGIPGTAGSPGTTGADGSPGTPGSDGAPGAQGAPGVQGDPGAPGSAGSVGPPGQPGSQIFTGSSVPSVTLGNIKDLYVQKDGRIWQKLLPYPLGMPFWNLLGTFKGTQGIPGKKGDPGRQGFDGRDGASGVPGNQGGQGAGGSQGPPGPPGPAGSLIAGGKGKPSRFLGNVNDYYIQTDSGDVWHKVEDFFGGIPHYHVLANFMGPPGKNGKDGLRGQQGVPGPTGARGTDGSGAVSSVSNVDATLTVTPTTGAVVASLNLAHANTWTAKQTFGPNLITSPFGSGGQNEAFGSEAGNSSATGADNTCVGSKAGLALTNSNEATLIGYKAGTLLTSGGASTVVGSTALVTATTGAFNTAMGAFSLRLTTGADNTGFGYGTLQNNSTGTENTAIGIDAGDDNTTGAKNIYIGSESGNGGLTITGDGNILIGYLSTLTAGTNADGIAFGRAASAASNELALGPSINVQTGKVLSSTSAMRSRADMTDSNVDNTDATRKYRRTFNVFDTATREAMRHEATGSAPAIGFLGATASARQTSGENLTNNVTAGGVDGTIANFTSLTVYSTDAAAIRNDIYQLARKLKQVNDALRLYGLLT